ncbi:hypothetical protein GO755_34890 [Spirosoma sp. HMF4905]|uniref:SGNH hydrolase-type esterase domain-containing protein n=1 Tax=Spirosoma arboris TaxID=2682092 RepID=A0A7K1SNA0_9BACT|nr:hypothetical protein [Spirosoma arboris]MVM35261.1 hypothetical protein [Spirosoma arboris]
MKKLLLLPLLLVWFFGQAQTTIQPHAMRFYWQNGHLFQADSLGTVKGDFVGDISIYPFGTKLIAVTIGKATEYYPFKQLLNKSGVPYSTVSVDAAIAAYTTSIPATTVTVDTTLTNSSNPIASVVVKTAVNGLQNQIGTASSSIAQNSTDIATIKANPTVVQYNLQGTWSPSTNTPVLSTTTSLSASSAYVVSTTATAGVSSTVLSGSAITYFNGDYIVATQAGNWVRVAQAATVGDGTITQVKLDTDTKSLLWQQNDPASGYSSKLLDPKGRLLWGITLDGSFEAGKYQTSSIAGSALKPSSVGLAQVGTDVTALMWQTLDPASGYRGALTDPKGRLGWGIRLDGSFEVGKYLDNSIAGTALKASSIGLDRLATDAQSAITNAGRPTTALDALALAAKRRIDFLMIGDSNQLKDGTGWDHGFNYALGNRFGLYASAIYGPRGNMIQGAEFGGTGNFGTAGGGLTSLENYDLASEPYSQIADGVTYNSQFNGVSVAAGATTFNVASALRFWYAYGTFTTGSGSFRVGFRQGTTPYTTFGSGAVINTNTGAETYQLGYTDLAANSGRTGLALEAKWTLPSSTPITGPWQGFFCRLEDTSKKTGVSVHTLYGVGGQSLWDMGTQLNAYSAQKLKNYFAEARRLQLSQNLKPIIVVYVNSGLNDQNEDQSPSLGWRADMSPTSANAYIDNMEAIIKRAEDVYEYAGWDKSELYFLLMPSHPVSDPDAAKLISYRKVCSSLASRKNTSVVDLTNLTTATEMAANNWYLKQANGVDNDVFHLVQAAYEVFATRVVSLIPVVQ